MIALIWNWIVSWIFGWGGVGALVTAAAWAAWFFSPVFKMQLLQIAIGVTLFTIASTYFFSRGYEIGYTFAIKAVARDDNGAMDRVKEGIVDLARCRAIHGTWDVPTESCK